MFLGACGAVPPAQTPDPPAVPAPAPKSPTAALTGTLAARILGGGPVTPGQHLAPDDQLVFDVSGPPGAYLYLLEQGAARFQSCTPARGGSIQPATP